jgi:tRNA-N(6)-(isopentenyl)adenosine-37 thiotransferase enzyme MiaB
MRKIHITTFGCQMNKLDSELAAEALESAGHAIVTDENAADTVIFNTCSVRDHAEQRVLSRLAQLRPRHDADPDFRLGLMGCFAEREGEDLLARLPYLDFAVGTRQFMRLPEIMETLDKKKAGLFGETDKSFEGIDTAHPRQRHQGVQGFVSVMRGCSNRCSYCIVPDVRGPEISRPMEEIVHEVLALANAGAREVTLLGQNIDAYGKGEGRDLADLLWAIDQGVGESTGLVRLRFVTSHPRDISRKLVEAVRDIPRVSRHFHMPAQSGSDKVLKDMRRGYNRAEYDEKLAMIKEIIPEAMVASDFIVGFPGESEEDFAATLGLVEKAGYQNSYIFKYSPRPGTPSALTMDDNVPDREKRRRNQLLLDAQTRVNQERSEKMVGTRQTIMVEGVSARDASKWTGRTDTNLICVFEPGSGTTAAGDLLELDIHAATPLTLFGKIVYK